MFNRGSEDVAHIIRSDDFGSVKLRLRRNLWASPLGEINPVLHCLMWSPDATEHN